MTEHTVTIQTSDHGAVTVPCPLWCAGEHPDGNLRQEISHVGPSVDVMVGTARGPRRLIEMMLWCDPYPVPGNPHGAEVHVAVHLLDGDHFDYDVAGLEGLAADLLEAAGRVRLMARRLGVENRGEGL